MKGLILYVLLLLSTAVMAQEKDKMLPQGNDDFIAGNLADAEAKYRISKSKFPDKAAASYNMGNAIYKMKQPLEAGYAYLAAIEKAKTRSEKHRAFHNLGNVFMIEKEYAGAVDAYKRALINNPDDDETRYNYALAKKFLKENPPKPEDKDKKDKDDKKKDKPDDKKPGEGDNPKDKPGDKPKPSQPKPDPKQGSGISKQRLESLLDAVNNEERKVQDKVQVRQKKGKPVQTEKDW